MTDGYDLVVIGAGPAGASCARRAGELGLSVLVLEAATFPRSKPCAGGLTSRAIELAGAGVKAHLRESPRTLKIKFGRATVIWEGSGPVLHTATRSELDAFLSERAVEAGAEIEFGGRVDAISEEGDHVSVLVGGTPRRGTFVLRADGARSALGGGHERRRDRRFGAVYVRAFPPAEGDLGEHVGTVMFDPTATPRGYGWIFPKHDHLNVGVFAQRALDRGSGDALRSFIRANGLGRWRTEGPFAAPIPGRVGTPTELAPGRVMVAGDAAGLVDPITGEGISYALASGRIAAEAAADALREGRDAGSAYVRRVRGEVIPLLQETRSLGALVYLLGPRGLRGASQVPFLLGAAVRLRGARRVKRRGDKLRVERARGGSDQ